MTSKIRTLSIYIESNSLQKLRVSEVMIYQDCKTPKNTFNVHVSMLSRVFILSRVWGWEKNYCYLQVPLHLI